METPAQPTSDIAVDQTKSDIVAIQNDAIYIQKTQQVDQVELSKSATPQDLSLINEPTPQSVAECLKQRFEQDLVYVSLGNIIISVNPYKQVKPVTSGPNVTQVAKDAYLSMQQKAEDQCILISGESGSGKSEISKLLNRVLVELTEFKNKDYQLTLLESFGNAKTLLNDNSSRFAKYFEIQFNYKAQPVGGLLATYLPEKSRVVVFNRKYERNFHVFYQLCQSEVWRSKLQLKTYDQYKFLQYDNHSEEDDLKDKAGLAELEKQLQELKIQYDHLFEGLAATIHLGNFNFTLNEDQVTVLAEDSKDALKSTSQLLGISEQTLLDALTKKTVRDMKKSGTDMQKNLGMEQVLLGRDALAKVLYSRHFSWLVSQINSQIKAPPQGDQKSNSIGILDIFGFETFDANGYVQFCINYTNEKLQQLFIDLTLKDEQAEYARENIPWTPVDFFDNNVICELIEAKGKGIMAILDEECVLPGDVTDFTFLDKLNVALVDNPRFETREKLKSDKSLEPNMFRVLHFAGAVTYTVEGFMDRNKDALYKDILYALNTSSNPLIKELFPENPKQGDMKRPDTLSVQFKTSINSLMSNLKTKNPHYVRCIKPNNHKKSDEFDLDLVSNQVQYLGIMESIAVRKAGYSHKLRLYRFIEKYKSLCPQTWPQWTGAEIEGVNLILKATSTTEYAIGTTQIYLRNPNVVQNLEQQLNVRKNSLATLIQNQWRKRQHRQKNSYKFKAATLIKATWKMYKAKQKFRAKRLQLTTVNRIIRGHLARRRVKRMRQKQPKYAVVTIQRFWRLRLVQSFIAGPVKDAITQNDWRQVVWPKPTPACQEALVQIKSLFMRYKAKEYRAYLAPEHRDILECKAISQDYLKGKKGYKNSITAVIRKDDAMVLSNKEFPQTDGLICSFGVNKYHMTNITMYAPRVVALTSKVLIVFDVKSSTVKDCFPLQQIRSISVSPYTDGVCIISIGDSNDYVLSLMKQVNVFGFIARVVQASRLLQVMPSIRVSDQVDVSKNGKIVRFKFIVDKTVSELQVEATKTQVVLHVPSQ